MERIATRSGKSSLVHRDFFPIPAATAYGTPAGYNSAFGYARSYIQCMTQKPHCSYRGGGGGKSHSFHRRKKSGLVATLGEGGGEARMRGIIHLRPVSSTLRPSLDPQGQLAALYTHTSHCFPPSAEARRRRRRKKQQTSPPTAEIRFGPSKTNPLFSREDGRGEVRGWMEYPFR